MRSRSRRARVTIVLLVSMLGVVATTKAAFADAGDAPSTPPPADGSPGLLTASSPPPTQDAPSTCDSDSSTCSVCECRPRWRRNCPCRRKPELSLSVTGIRPSLTRVSSPTATTSDAGLAFAGDVDTYALDGTTHGSAQWVLGGGEAGFEGTLAGTIEVGYRLDVTENQGPFARIGFDGRMQGNNRFYFSQLELPRVTLGYQYASRRALVEFGARTGEILAGRFDPGEIGHRVTSNSGELGMVASAQFDVLKFEATAYRINTTSSDRSTVDVGRALLCGVVGRVGVCGDFAVMRGGADFGTAGTQEAIATYAGVTVGVARW